MNVNTAVSAFQLIITLLKNVERTDVYGNIFYILLYRNKINNFNVQLISNIGQYEQARKSI